MFLRTLKSDGHFCEGWHCVSLFGCILNIWECHSHGRQPKQDIPAWMFIKRTPFNLMCFSLSLSSTEMLILSLSPSVLCFHLFRTHYGLSAWLLCNYPNGDWHRCNISAVLDEPLLTGCDCQSKCHKRLHSSCASV